MLERTPEDKEISIWVLEITSEFPVTERTCSELRLEVSEPEFVCDGLDWDSNTRAELMTSDSVEDMT